MLRVKIAVGLLLAFQTILECNYNGNSIECTIFFSRKSFSQLGHLILQLGGSLHQLTPLSIQFAIVLGTFFEFSLFGL